MKCHDKIDSKFFVEFKLIDTVKRVTRIVIRVKFKKFILSFSTICVMFKNFNKEL